MTQRAGVVIDNQSPVIAIDWSTVATTTTTTAAAAAAATGAASRDAYTQCLSSRSSGSESRLFDSHLGITEWQKCVIFRLNCAREGALSKPTGFQDPATFCRCSYTAWRAPLCMCVCCNRPQVSNTMESPDNVWQCVLFSSTCNFCEEEQFSSMSINKHLRSSNVAIGCRPTCILRMMSGLILTFWSVKRCQVSSPGLYRVTILRLRLLRQPMQCTFVRSCYTALGTIAFLMLSLYPSNQSRYNSSTKRWFLYSTPDRQGRGRERKGRLGDVEWNRLLRHKHPSSAIQFND